MNLISWYLNTLKDFYMGFSWYVPSYLNQVPGYLLYLYNAVVLLLGLSFHNWYVNKVEQDFHRKTSLQDSSLRTLGRYVTLLERIVNSIIYAKIVIIGAYFYPSLTFVIESFTTCRKLGLLRFWELSFYYQSSVAFLLLNLIQQPLESIKDSHLLVIALELLAVAYVKFMNEKVITGNLFSPSGLLKFLLILDKSKKTVPQNVYSYGLALELLTNLLTGVLYQDSVKAVKPESNGTDTFYTFLTSLESFVSKSSPGVRVASMVYNLCRVYWWSRLTQAKNKGSDRELRDTFNEESKSVRHDFLFLHQLSKGSGAIGKLLRSFKQTLTLAAGKLFVLFLTSAWVKLTLQGNLETCYYVWAGLDLSWLICSICVYLSKVYVSLVK